MPFIETLNPYIEKIRGQAAVHREGFETLWSRYENKFSVVDLGCGNGHFLESYLEKQPEAYGLGIEKRFKRTFKTALKIERTLGERAAVVQGDIFDFLEESPEEFWNEIWIQFPDPWPKDRHSKNRMIRPSLLEDLHRILKKGGRFCFRSDCRAYWEELQIFNSRFEFFPIVTALKGDLFSELPQTLFLQKMFRDEVPIYSLEFKKLF